MPTPIVFDALSRFLATGFREIDVLHLPTAFQAFFGRPETSSFTIFSPNANDLDIEIERMDETVAALVPRGINAKFGGTTHADILVGRGTAFSRKYPLTEESGTISGDQITNRVIPDEGPYENWTREVRAQRLAQKIYKIAVQRHIRLQEVLASQSIRTGKQSAQSLADTTVNIYDFRRNTNLTISPSHGWGYSTPPDPLADIDAACDLVRFYGKNAPDMAVFGGDAMNYFLHNTNVYTAYAHHFYWDLIQFNAKFQPDEKFARFIEGGMIPFGQLRTPKGYSLTIFTYPEIYASANVGGTATKYFPDSGVLFAYSGARCDRYFGPPERVPITSIDAAKMMERFGFNPAVPPLPAGVMGATDVVPPQMYYVDTYDDVTAKAVTIRVQAAPIYATTRTDCFAYGAFGVAT
jgi:hypothetical protein